MISTKITIQNSDETTGVSVRTIRASQPDLVEIKENFSNQ
jgi:hypothetical protein